jgi:hypothetical protein
MLTLKTAAEVYSMTLDEMQIQFCFVLVDWTTFLILKSYLQLLAFQVEGNIMYRLPTISNHSEWYRSIPRPVVAFFVSYKINSPLRLIPMGDMLKSEFEMTIPQFVLQDKAARWVVSVQDNSNNRTVGTKLLGPLELSEEVPISLQKFRASITVMNYAFVSTFIDVTRTSKGIGDCVKDPAYSYEEVFFALELKIGV